MNSQIMENVIQYYLHVYDSAQRIYSQNKSEYRTAKLTFALSIRLCFINIYTNPNHKPAPYSNADALNIVVQREKKDEILMRASRVRRGIGRVKLG